MRLTTKGRHAVTALIHLANRTNELHTVSLAEISSIQGISLSYLEQLFSRLRRHAIVQGTRGPGGGYRLAQPAHRISIAQILDAIEDRTRDERLRQFATICPDGRNFAQDKWNAFSRNLYDYLDGVTLGQFVDAPAESERRAVQRSQANFSTPVSPGHISQF